MKYKRYLLLLLVLILAFNFVDRFALGVLLQDIKRDLMLSDTQLGLMSGIAFALFYSVMGIPVARWADRGNRVVIIAVSVGLWSALVAACSAAQSFAQLLLIRVGVGVGEAGFTPSANSLLPDVFSRKERARAAAIYQLGAPLGVVIGYLCAGWLDHLFGWRTTFMLLGVPGLFLAILAWATLVEPRRMLGGGSTTVVSEASGGASPCQMGLIEVLRTLWGKPTFRHLLLAVAITNFFSYGIAQWQPAFFMRSHGTSSAELGTWFALIFGVFGMVGTYYGGEWASNRAAGNERGQLRVMAVVLVANSVLSATAYLSATKYPAYFLLAIASFIGYGINGPLAAILQTLVAPNMRATAHALMNFFINLIGLGVGPLITGVLSDAYRGWAGEQSLRYALLTLSPGYLWAAWHYVRASSTVAQELKAAEASQVPRSGGELVMDRV